MKSFFLLAAALCLCASSLCLLGVAATAGEPTPIANSLGMEFVRIPAGEFLMGSPDDDDQADADERPQHRVRISRDFHLGVYEVTQRQYEAVMGENPSWFSPHGGGRELVAGRNTARLPVEMVSWDEALLFCRRLGELPAERDAGRIYRLPTEAEWEYAARAGSTTRYDWGDTFVPGRANVFDPAVPASVPQTQPVGTYAANAWGLYDLHGNVWEWCVDRYAAETYPNVESGTTIVDPQGPAEGTGRVVRGGDYRFDASQARTANRDFTRPSRRDWGNGLRVVLEAR